jgi:ParB/RepB/Spo0J family partition protein
MDASAAGWGKSTSPVSLLADLIVTGCNDRQKFDSEGIASLAGSIKDQGLLNPILVRPIYLNPLTGERVAIALEGDQESPAGWDVRYEIVAGERRYRACLSLGYRRVSCWVRCLTDPEAMALMLLENTARQDLNPLELARAFHVRITRLNWAVEDVAKVAGVSRWTVERRLALLQLQPSIADLVAAGHFPTGHAELLSRLDHYRQLIALRIYQGAASMPLERFRGVVSELLAQQAQDSLIDLETYAADKAASLQTQAAQAKQWSAQVPSRQDLPQPRRGKGDTASRFVLRYIQDLEAAGLASEASTLGTLYLALVDTNLMGDPS